LLSYVVKVVYITQRAEELPEELWKQMFHKNDKGSKTHLSCSH